MSNNYEIFDMLINEIVAKTGLDEAEISLKAKRNHGYISQIRSRYKNKGEQPSEKFIEHLRLHFLDVNDIKQSDNVQGKVKSLQSITFDEEKELEMQTLLSITKIYAESHVGLVRSHENLTIAHKHSQEDNSRLITMMGQKIDPNSDGAKENQQESFSAEPPLLMRLADGGVGTFWKTRGEGLAALGKMLTVEESVKK